MAFLYWIRHKDHTNIFLEGYVGVTNTTVKARFSSHMVEVNKQGYSKSRCIVHNAIIKHGIENIVVETIVEAPIEYVYELEFKLRSEPYIGWNMAIGGESNGMLGRKQTTKQKAAVSQALRGKPKAKHVLDAAAKANKERVRSEEELLKRSKTMQDKHLLDWPSTNLKALSRINDMYASWLNGNRQYKTTTLLKIPYAGMRAIFNRFDRGYVPMLDKRMQDFVENYIKENGIYTEDNTA